MAGFAETAEGIEDGVEIGADAQAVEVEIVSRVSDHGEVGWIIECQLETVSELRAANASGQCDKLHSCILPLSYTCNINFGRGESYRVSDGVM